jgi:hypothetical protein
LHRGQLLVQIEDAEECLGLLKGDAISAAKGLEGIAEKLRRNAGLEPSPSDFTPEGDVENRLTPDEVVSFATVNSVSKLIEGMKKARQDVFTLWRAKGRA